MNYFCVTLVRINDSGIQPCTHIYDRNVPCRL